MRSRRGRTRLTCGAILAVAIAVAAGVAASEPSASVPSVSQYVEAMPAGEGTYPVGGAVAGGWSLPPTVEQRLDFVGTQTASKLREVATSTRYGAPQHGVARPTAAEVDRNGLVAGLSAVADSGGPATVAALLVLLTVAAGALGARRRIRRT